jgi:hypothetical protein
MPSGVSDEFEPDSDYMSEDGFEPYVPSSPQYSPTAPEPSPAEPSPAEPPPQAVFPIDALGPDVRALFEHLECSVCLELQADMLIVCDSGHSVCKVCYDGVCNMGGSNSGKCPTCRNSTGNPRPNLAVSGVAAALGIQPRSAAPAPPAAVPVIAVPVVQMDVLHSEWSRLRRSLIGKMKVRVRKIDQLHAERLHADFRPSSWNRRMSHLLNQVADLGVEWRRNTHRNMPVRMSNEISEAFYHRPIEA